jgi:hypothetical protein
LEGTLQTVIIHILAFFGNLCLLNFFVRVVGKMPSLSYRLFLLVIVLFDLFAFMYLDFIFYFASQLGLFCAILLYYYADLPKTVQSVLQIVFVLVIAIFGAFVNERTNCSAMLSAYPEVPFHAIIEFLGLIIVYLLSSTFYKM